MLYGDVFNLAHNYKVIIRRDWEIHITHIYLEQNKLADHLAKQAMVHDWGIIDVIDPLRLG